MHPLVFLLPMACPLTPDEGRTLCLAADDIKRSLYLEKPSFPPAQHSLASQVLLRYAAAKTLGKPMHNVCIRYTGRGRPTLPGTGLFGSISHTDGLCVCALCDVPVGVDAERIRPYSARVAARVFSEEEKRLLERSEDADKTFFEVWTKRESFVKCLGTGLADISAPLPENARFQTFPWQDAFVISVCTFTKTS